MRPFVMGYMDLKDSQITYVLDKKSAEFEE